MSTQHIHGYKRGTLRTKHINRSFHPHYQPALQVLLILSFLIQPRSIVQPITATASEPVSNPPANETTGGHLGWPVSPALDLRTAADAHVTPIGSYKTSIPIEIPSGPGAPSLSLNYDSAMGLGIAGVGWDISTGWPSLIARDTRFGTPTWDYTSAWTWGGASLVAENQIDCKTKGICTYRTAPDSLSIISIDQSTATSAATVTLISGVQLFYEAIHYDGVNYPHAPVGETDVFAYLLRKVRDPNGYWTCFENQHWGDKSTGRAAVLTEIRYGPAIVDCKDPVKSEDVHRVLLAYNEPGNGAYGYHVPVSYRFGAPVSFNSLLSNISVVPASKVQPEPVANMRYDLDYEPSENTETRLPRLNVVYQLSWSGGQLLDKRILRKLTYGNRNSNFDTEPILLDLGPNSNSLPESLSGSITRHIRTQDPISLLLIRPWPFVDEGFDPFLKDLLQIGDDQRDSAAPPATALTKQWTLADINGDGLLDMLMSNERGQDNEWSTYETEKKPGPRPPQQWILINEGIVGNQQITSRLLVNTDSSAMTIEYDPYNKQSGRTQWIWQEGLGRGRTGMPQSITSPDIPDGGVCPPAKLGKDTRIWPYFPDGSSVSTGFSAGDKYAADINWFSSLGSPVDGGYEALGRLAYGFVPRSSVSAQLSGWRDMTGDGVPDWIVTPAMIERFNFPVECLGWAHEPSFAGTPWYRVQGDPNSFTSPTGRVDYDAESVPGPAGPIGLPLSFSVDYSHGQFFGQTLVIGSSIMSLPSLAQGPNSPSFWMAIADLSAQSLAPRPLAGTSSAGLRVDLSSGSTALAQYAISTPQSQATFSSAAGAFAKAVPKINFDITLLGGGSVGSGHSRAELLDFNADGYPDYLLYDSVGFPTKNQQKSKPGGILLFLYDSKLNDGSGGFLTPIRINDGYETGYETKMKEVQDAASQIAAPFPSSKIPIWFPKKEPVSLLYARGYCEVDPQRGEADVKTVQLNCTPLKTMAREAIAYLKVIKKVARPFIIGSAEALPSQKGMFLKAVDGAIHEVECALKGLPPGATATEVCPIPPLFVDGPARLTRAIVEARQAAGAISETMTQLAYPSALNALTKSESRIAPWQVISQPGRSMMVQTSGMMDLNGDGLPDYIITQDANKRCAVNEWAVYWGTGTSNLSKGHGFFSRGVDTKGQRLPDCIQVPPPPPDVENPFVLDPWGPGIVKDGFETLPMQVDFTQHQGSGLPGAKTNLVTHSYVSLLDWNQDGRPDLVVARPAKKDNMPRPTFKWDSKGDWDPAAKSNTWTVLLNSGRGFDLGRPIQVQGLNKTLSLKGAKAALYPAIKSGYSEYEDNFLGVAGKQRSGSSLDLGFIDVNADGTADIAQRVTHGSNRAGILFWSRAGTGPQDMLIEELDPLTGARTLVEYWPSPNFQWKKGIPDGNPPPGGHRAATGMSAFLVRTVIVEPLAGHVARQTALSYDYKDPHFDPVERVFRGFGRITVTPLDLSTGNTITTAPAVVIYNSQPNGGRGGETLERLVDGNGAPIAESLHGYTETLSITASESNKVGINQTYFSARNHLLTIEYPPDLRKPAILDFGFDGRWPLANRADRIILADILPEDPQQPSFDNLAATGGAAHFDATKQQRIIFTVPQPSLNLQEFTIEVWVNPSHTPGQQVLFQYPGGYELSLDGTGKAVITANIDGSLISLTSSQSIEKDTWTHVATSYDGATLRLFVKGKEPTLLAAPGKITYPATLTGGIRIGCGLNSSNGKDIDCFHGYLGELRIYPDAWESPPRINETRMAYRLQPLTASDFGLPLEVWELGDVAVESNDEYPDDVYRAVTYAQPQKGSRVRNLVATEERRIFNGPDPHDLGDYLDYAVTYYDGLEKEGEVITGNVTKQAIYDGEVPFVKTAQIGTDMMVTETRYDPSRCAGVPTQVVDPEGAVTTTTYDVTCSFALSVTNSLGHTTNYSYYGVNKVLYKDTVRGIPIAGLYGQLRSSIDPNGAATWRGYDSWGRPTLMVGPYDTKGRPGIRVSYQDPRISKEKAVVPALVKTETWDDIQHDYITSYTFGDGQTQVEAVRNGKEDWIISGAQDFDAAGRVIVTYKPRFLSEAVSEVIPVSGRRNRCLRAGTWCNFLPSAGIITEEDLKQDPLRNPAKVAHIQTAYDNQGRIIRVYGPDVPWCDGDPSAIDVSGKGGLLCDAKAKDPNLKPPGHFTSYEYPEVGAMRVLDARQIPIPTMSYYDVHNRLQRTVEYVLDSNKSPVLYAFVDYKYDQDGNVITIQDIDGNTTEAGYDALGRQLWSDDPDIGQWSYTYNKRGQLHIQTDARGAQTENIYDPLGRIIRTHYSQPAVSTIVKQYTFEGGLGDILTSGNVSWRVLSTLPMTPPNQALVFSADSGSNTPSSGKASFDVDLTNATESEAELSFRYIWNARPVDRMSVEYRISGTSQLVTLVSHSEITKNPAEKNLLDMTNASTIEVKLPAEAIGKRVSIFFSFDSVSPVPARTPSTWVVDDIRVHTSSPPLLEDVVERSYDSLELASAYESSVLDLTFDVPDELRDRSRYQHQVSTSNTSSVEGVSGRGLDFQISSLSSLTVQMSAVSPKTSGITVQTWANPRDSLLPAPQYLIFKENEYALIRDSDDTLRCQIFVDRTWMTTKSDVPLVPDVWSHAALTYDGSDLRCYVNGIQWEDSTQSTLSVTGKLIMSGGTVNIGNHNGVDGFFNGQLDEVRVLDFLRHPSEVLADALSPLRHGPPRGNVLDLTFSDPSAPQLDASGASNHASHVPIYMLWPGKAGTGVDFGGASVNAISVPHSPSLASDELSAEVWVKTIKNQNQGDRLLVGKWDPSQAPGWRLALADEGRIRFEVNTAVEGSNTYTLENFITVERVNDGEWHHVAATYDHVTGTNDGKEIRVYIDGKPAHRICQDPESGKKIDCSTPEPICEVQKELVVVDNVVENLEINVCTKGTIKNKLPVYIGAYHPTYPSLGGMLDEIRLSNYAKRDFEVAASARPYYEYSHALGQQVAVRNGVADDISSFDLLGGVVSTQRRTHLGMLNLNSHDGMYLVRSAFDNLGRIRSLRYPDGEVVVSNFDRGGAQVSLTGYGDFAGIGDDYGVQPYLSGAGLTSTGRPAKLIYGNGVVTSFSYDDGPTKNPITRASNVNGTFGNELLARQFTVVPPIGTTNPAQVLQDQHYIYDPVGNLLHRQDFAEPGPSTPAAPYNATYIYDELSRLKSYATQFGTMPAGSGEYDYDALGNLTEKEGAALQYGGKPECSRSVPPPHAVTTWSRGRYRTDYCYDANGALTTANHTENLQGGKYLFRQVEYTHNVRGMLASIRDTSFQPSTTGQPSSVDRFYYFYYDGEGTRVHKVDPPLVPGDKSQVTTDVFPFYRLNKDGDVEKYYFAVGRRIARRVGTTSRFVFWYHAEHLGSTNLMTDMHGHELTDAYSEYMPFGERLPTSGNTSDPDIDRSGGFQFTGKELDDTGLYYFGARYYDPAIGRFIEPDSITPDVWPQSLNRYSYVHNNPLIYTDPSGNRPISFQDSLRRANPLYIDTGNRVLNEILNETPISAPWGFMFSGGNVPRAVEELARIAGATDADIQSFHFAMLLAGMEVSVAMSTARPYLEARVSVATDRMAAYWNAFTNANGEFIGFREAPGVYRGIRLMESRGWRLTPYYFKYTSTDNLRDPNRGIDLVFRWAADLDKWCVLECKAGGSPKVLGQIGESIGGVRQGSFEYIGIQLQTYIELGGPNAEIARQLIWLTRSGYMQSYANFGNKLYELRFTRNLLL